MAPASPDSVPPAQQDSPTFTRTFSPEVSPTTLGDNVPDEAEQDVCPAPTSPAPEQEEPRDEDDEGLAPTSLAFEPLA
eukprot:8908315-Lingulodinium_polyedra.AAC.1